MRGSSCLFHCVVMANGLGFVDNLEVESSVSIPWSGAAESMLLAAIPVQCTQVAELAMQHCHHRQQEGYASLVNCTSPALHWLSADGSITQMLQSSCMTRHAVHENFL